MTTSGDQPAASADNGGTDCEHEWYRSGTRTQVIWHDVPKTSVIMPLQFVEYDVYRCTGCNATREVRAVPQWVTAMV